MNNEIKINGYLFIDNKGERFYSRYFGSKLNNDFEKERNFEKELFKQGMRIIGNFSNNDETNIFYINEVIIVFKAYLNYFLFIFSEKDENELIMEEILNTFDEIIKQNSKIKNVDLLYENFSNLIVYFDDIIEDGYVINLNSKDILNRRNISINKESSEPNNKLSLGSFFFGKKNKKI